jgi:hypothetical protein
MPWITLLKHRRIWPGRPTLFSRLLNELAARYRRLGVDILVDGASSDRPGAGLVWHLVGTRPRATFYD